MSEYLSKDLALGIQGVAIKSGALKKQEEDREAIMDFMRRSITPKIQPTVKHRVEMPTGFRIGDRSEWVTAGEDLMTRQSNARPMSTSNIPDSRLLNSLSKNEIFARMGIDGSKELEVDWESVDQSNNPKTKLELAERMFHILQKEKEKLEHRRNHFGDKLSNYMEQQEEQRHAQSAFSEANNRPSSRQSASGMGSGRKPPIPFVRTSGALPVVSAPDEEFPHGEQPWTHLSKDRADYIKNKGIYTGKVPYKDEVDMMHEDIDRYQEVNHWYSSMEKPNEDNLEVLKRLNHDRIAQIGQIYAEKVKQQHMGDADGFDDQYDHTALMRKVGEYAKSNKEINQEKQNYKDKFKRYLYNKEKMKNQPEQSPDQYRKDFDRFQCTSPNTKSHVKPYSVNYKANIRVEPSGLTSQQIEKMRSDSDALHASNQDKRMTTSSAMGIPKSDEDEMLHWIWNKINPTYKTYISKREFLEFLMREHDIRDVFNLKDHELVHIVEAIVTEQPDYLTFEEFANFMQGNLKMKTDMERRQNYAMTGSRSDFPKGERKKECLLTEEIVSIMRENFEKLDKYEDMIVPRAQLIEAIRKDVRAKKFLNKGVVYLPQVRKEISLSKVLHQIEQEEFTKASQLDAGDSNFISSKKFISWKNFMDYFLNYAKNDEASQWDLEFKKDTADDQDVLDMPKKLKEQMRQIFNQMKDEDGYVKSYDYLDKLKNNEMVISNLEAQIRSKARNGEVPSERLRETMARVENEIDDYTDWDEFIQYFTRRGVPTSVEKTKHVPQLTHVVVPNSNSNIDGRYPNQSDQVKSTEDQMRQIARSQIPSLTQQPVYQENFNAPYQPSYVVGGGYQGESQAPNINRGQPVSNFINDKTSYNMPFYGPHGEERDKNNISLMGDQRNQQLDHTKMYSYTMNPNQGVDMLAQTQKGLPSFNGQNNHYSDNYSNPQASNTYPNQQQYHSSTDPNAYQVPQRSNPSQAYPNNQQSYPHQNYSTGQQGDYFPESYYPRPTNSEGGRFDDYEDDPYIIDDYVQYGDEGKNRKITVPQGMDFHHREMRRAQSVKNRKFKQYIDEKRKEEEEALRFQFRAKSVPKAVREPLFDKIMNDQEQRRAQVKKNSIAITRANENPFSFYERDKQKPKKFKEDFSQNFEPFKAKEVPWFCSTELYQREQEFRENQRQERVNRRAQEVNQV